MGLQISKSKDELLYEKCIEGDIEGIKILSSQGAGLEYVDQEGKTPLIAACMSSERYILAKTLLELGANVNAYRPGLHAGTPLHHAAKRGLDQTVRLLLSHGANLFVRNDDCQTPLDVARIKGFTNVARLIESRICFFSGWLKEFYGPGFLEAFAPKLLSRKIWVVVIPRALPNHAKPLKLELAIYSNFQDAQPRAVVPLWKADIEEPKLRLQDLTLMIFDKPTGTRYKFAASHDGDKQQIQSFYLACRGISQVIQASAPTDSTQTAEEAAELALAINASLQPAVENRLPSHPNHNNQNLVNLNSWENSTNNNSQNGWGLASESSPETSSNGWIDKPTKEQNNGWGLPARKPNQNTQTSKPDTSKGWANSVNNITHNGWVPASESSSSKASSSGWIDEPTNERYNGWELPDPKLDKNTVQANITPAPAQSSGGAIAETNVEDNTAVTYMPHSHYVPSAPPIPMEGLDGGPIQYPTIDFSPVEFFVPSLENEKAGTSSQVKDEDSSCVICLDAPVEGACVPCGHMAGCMACLNEVKTKKGDCPVCRAKITQVIRIYAV